MTAARPLREDKDVRKVWRLAGDGWKKTLEQHKQAVLSRFIRRFITPRPENVDKLFESLIGFSDLSNRCKWNKMPQERAIQRLGHLIDQRGEIAHRVTSTKSLQKQAVARSVNFVFRLSVVFRNAVRVFLNDRTGTYPWASYSFGSVQ